jgi:hypothetical protein
MLVLMGLRGYTTIWKSTENKIVKQVNYPSELRFLPHDEFEFERKQKLPYNWVYDAELVNNEIEFFPKYQITESPKHNT